MKFLILLLMSIPSFGATLSYTITNGDGTAGSGACVIDSWIRAGWGNGINCDVTVTVSGAGSASYTTNGSNEFFPSVRWCKPVFSLGTVTDCTPNPSGTMTAGDPPLKLRLYLQLDEQTNPLGAHCPLTSGVYSCTFTGIKFNGGSDITTTVALSSRVAPPIVTTWNKQTAADLVSAGCSYSFPYLVEYPDSCPPQITGYPQATYDLPPVGQPYTDLRYGTKACILGNAPVEAPIQRYFSADGAWVTLKADTGTSPAGIYDTATCTRVYDYPAGVSGMQYLPNDRRLTAYGYPKLTLVAYGANGSLVLLKGGSPPTLTQTTIWTPLHGETASNDGGSSTLTSDGLKFFYSCYSPVNCGQDNQPIANYNHWYLVDAYTGQTLADMDMLDARVAAGFPTSIINRRAVLITDQGADGKYIVQTGQANPNLSMYFWVKRDGTWGTQGLENDDTGGTQWALRSDCVNYSRYCSGVVHQTPVNTNGLVFFNKAASDGNTPASALNNPMFTDPILKTRALEIGGGGAFIHNHPEHMTASVYPWSLYVGSAEPRGTDNPQMPILSISTANPAVITMDTSIMSTLPGLAVSGQIYIGCRNGDSGTQQMMGFWTVSAIQFSPYRLTLSGLNWTGAYSGSGNCLATLKQAPLNSQDLYHIAVVRVGQVGLGARAIQIAPIGKQYSTNQVNGALDCADYWTVQTKPQMSPNGMFVTATTNNGQPCWARTILYQVPWQMRATRDYEAAPGFAVLWKPRSGGSGVVDIDARLPISTSVTCTVSTASNLLVGISTVVLAGPDVRRVGTFTGTPGTQYWWQCTDPSNNQIAAVGTFVPLS